MQTLEEEPEVFGVNPGRNAMPQVRNPRLCLSITLETLAHPLNFSLDCFFPAVQHVWIQVALERDTWADGFPSDGRFDTPIQSNHIVSTGPSDIIQRAVRSLGEEGEGNNWEPLGL